jgi:hypothetical protein
LKIDGNYAKNEKKMKKSKAALKKCRTPVSTPTDIHMIDYQKESRKIKEQKVLEEIMVKNFSIILQNNYYTCRNLQSSK